MASIQELSTSPIHLTNPVPARTAPNSPPAQRAEGASPFSRLVRGLSHEADRGEATVNGVLDASGRGVALDSTHLLALQAGIYRYGETMDLAARLVDKASSGVKTVIQGQ